MFVYDVNSGVYIDTVNVNNASGLATVDFKTSKLIYKAGTNVYSYDPTTETQISIASPAGNLDYLFIGSDSVYIGSTLYNAQNLTPILVNALPFNLLGSSTFNSTSYVYNYAKRHFVYKDGNQLKKCNRFGGALQIMSDVYVGQGPGFEMKSTINGDEVIFWNGGAFVFNNYWFMESTQTWLKMKDNGFVEQITPGHVSNWNGFEFTQYPKNTVVKLLFNKNCVDNQMVN